jgi:bile acid:Na+ symporter, BASS family
MKILRLLFLNRNVILILGVVVGLVWGKGAVWTEPLILPLLALVMTIATMGIDSGSLRSVRGILGPAFVGIAMNYLVLSGVIIFLSRYLITDSNLRTGFILVAAVPPAVAVIPFSFLLRGNNTFSLLGTLGGYLGALVIMPFIAIAFFGTSFISPLKLITIMVELILCPLLVGRVLHWFGIGKRFDCIKGPITNWSFSLITYTIVALNREMFLHDPLALAPTALIVIASTFILGWLIEMVSKRILQIPAETVTSLVLLGTLKNYGIAGGLALTLFGKEAASPSTVSSIFMIIYIIWLEWELHRRTSRKYIRNGKKL